VKIDLTHFGLTNIFKNIFENIGWNILKYTVKIVNIGSIFQILSICLQVFVYNKLLKLVYNDKLFLIQPLTILFITSSQLALYSDWYVRQGLSYSLCILSIIIKIKYEKKIYNILSYIVFIIAIVFHASSIIYYFVILLAFNKIKGDKNKIHLHEKYSDLLITLKIVIIIMMIIIPIKMQIINIPNIFTKIFPQFLYISEYSNSIWKPVVPGLAIYLMLIYALININIIKKYYKKYEIEIALMYSQVIIIIMTILSFSITGIASRLLFPIWSINAIPAIYFLKNKALSMKIIGFSCLLIWVSYNFIIVVIDNGGYNWSARFM